MHIADSSLVIGDSHIFAIKQAVKGYAIGNIECLYLRDKQYRPLYRGNLVNRKIRLAIKTGNTRAVFLSIRGNHHNILGLLNHPVPFDFVLKECPDLPLSDCAYIIPYSQIHEIMLDMIKDKVLLPIRLFSRLMEQNLYYLESPPPNPSDEHIKKYPEIFKDKLAELGISPKNLRLKLWKLQSGIIKDTCGKYGIRFISVPESSLDGDGFLKEKYWSKDPTHANAEYGRLVVDQINKIS